MKMMKDMRVNLDSYVNRINEDEVCTFVGDVNNEDKVKVV